MRINGKYLAPWCKYATIHGKLMRRAQYLPCNTRQSGATLIIALLVLVVILITAIAAMNNSGGQSKMAANSQFENVALNKAEVAMATAEDWLSTGNNFSNAGFTTRSAATPHLYPIANPQAPLTMAWDDTTSQSVNNDGTQRYFIELLAQNSRLLGSNQGNTGRASSGCSQVNMFRITARGQSARSALKYVQTIYSVKSC